MSEVIASTYEIKQKIGAGGGGVVYLARHLRLQKDVVLKADKRKITTDEALLRREVNVLKDLRHSNIPQVFDFFFENDTVYTVIDYIQGESLDKPLKRGEHYPQSQIVKWGCQLLGALSYLHSPIHGDPPRGYVHSDIKPANIMLTKDGVIRLIDFGIARLVKEDSDTDTEFLGTRGYAPPEQYGFGQTDARSDIYSLGVTIQRMLGKNYDGWMKKILAKCTKLDPENRYESAQNLLDDFDRRHWQQNLKQLKKVPAQNFAEPELDTYGKVNELVKNLEDLDAMLDSYLEVEDGNELQKRLIESGAWKVVEEFEKVVYSLTDEDFAEMRAALDEYPQENFDAPDSDTE